VVAALAPARLWDKERGDWVAPWSYLVLWNELLEGLCSNPVPDKSRVLELIDALFLELAKAERASKENAELYLAPDIASAWEEAGAGLLKAKRIAASEAL
jgi:hypothetical protein